MDGILKRSVAILKGYQTPWGAFPAAPSFPPYEYVWLRDGTFIAYALDLAGEGEAAGAFYTFMAETIVKHGHKVHRALRAAEESRPLGDEDYLHTRYTLLGEEGREPWGNFQLDGYGTYLWGLASHLGHQGRADRPYREAISLVTAYLCALWDRPCLDCWEEWGEYRHPSTWAAIYGGLRAALPWLEPSWEEKVLSVLDDLPAKLRAEFSREGHFVKFAGRPGVDANLLWLAVPFGVCSWDDPTFRTTVDKIEEDLLGGGLKRYKEDTYYGGGEWVLLTAWLAWYYRLRGREREARDLLEWVAAQADEEGRLPEQVPHNLNSPEHYAYWVRRWGPVARPLLWSHAMYIIAATPGEPGSWSGF
ncbi:MAG: Glycoside hydrolase 15-related protein [Moorella sp. 60_41]|nr:MAG: Glycoside hydrolase 15-related protein [Moorella sp. 60_41]